MKVIRIRQIAPLLLAVFGIGTADAQIPPDALPFEVDGPSEPDINRNSFGRGTVLRGIHNESIPTPDFGQVEMPPQLPGPPRYYVYIRYYACRPWFIHPYRGTTLNPNDLFTNIQCNVPDWPGQGAPLEELTKDQWGLGEPLVEIVDEGLVDENNEVAQQCSIDEQEVEHQNAAALGVQLPGGIQPIWHRPYYGLYCLRVRICVPYVSSVPGQVFNFWPKWRYRAHQHYCWRTWWHHCWFNHPTRAWIIYPWRPMCTPCVLWHRAGPDWVANICNVNRYRHWCLYGFRYYCVRYGNIVQRNPSPFISSLVMGAQPSPNSDGWLRPWPYPGVRYWPYRPYCTRWFWFRPLPWINYRYLPPVVDMAVAAPNDANGGGFVQVEPQPGQEPRFPQDPPGDLDENGMFPQRQAAPDSFFDIFVDLGECRYRAVESQVGDLDNSGGVGSSDFNRETRLRAQLENASVDVGDPGVSMPLVP